MRRTKVFEIRVHLVLRPDKIPVAAAHGSSRKVSEYDGDII